jgi:hypothetical protein
MTAVALPEFTFPNKLKFCLRVFVESLPSKEWLWICASHLEVCLPSIFYSHQSNHIATLSLVCLLQGWSYLFPIIILAPSIMLAPLRIQCFTNICWIKK